MLLLFKLNHLAQCWAHWLCKSLHKLLHVSGGSVQANTNLVHGLHIDVGGASEVRWSDPQFTVREIGVQGSAEWPGWPGP